MFKILQGLLRPQLRLLALTATVLLFATACGGSDSTPIAAEADTESASSENTSDGDSETGEPEVDELATAEVETDASEASDDEEADAGLSDDSDSENADLENADLDNADLDDADLDDATTSEVAEGDSLDEIEEPVPSDPTLGDGEAILTGMLPFFGITDVEAAIECIEGEAASENLSLEEITNGQGNGAMIASIRCRPEEMREMFSESFAALETSSMAATPAQLTCGFDTLLDWFPTVPLAEADAVFGGDAPEEMFTLIADSCDMSPEDAAAFLN